jgi:hypothetical protein
MTHLVDELKGEARDAIALMRAAALRARDVHARAELMRHMLMTARRVQHDPREAAVRFIVDHWLEAWGLTRASWAHVTEMEAFADAFHRYANAPTDANDAAVRVTCARLESAFGGAGVPIADRMAWRSMCAHGWWAQVKPAPAGLGREDRAWPARPFWDDGCLPECEGQ